ncbi:LysR family transcriptional regulator, partial [Serratia marcescens]
MKTMPKLAHLTMFKDIVHCGSLHEAAKKLAISQPTLSRVLKELEMTIGARLLERSNRGVRLTAVGELFYRRI